MQYAMCPTAAQQVSQPLYFCKDMCFLHPLLILSFLYQYSIFLRLARSHFCTIVYFCFLLIFFALFSRVSFLHIHTENCKYHNFFPLGNETEYDPSIDEVLLGTYSSYNSRYISTYILNYYCDGQIRTSHTGRQKSLYILKVTEFAK